MDEQSVIEKLHETLFEAAEVFFFPFFLANSMRAITDTQRSWMGMQPVKGCLWISILQLCPSHWKTEGTKAPKDPFKGTYLCTFFLIYVLTSLSFSVSLSPPLHLPYTFQSLKGFCLSRTFKTALERRVGVVSLRSMLFLGCKMGQGQSYDKFMEATRVSLCYLLIFKAWCFSFIC